MGEGTDIHGSGPHKPHNVPPTVPVAAVEQAVEVERLRARVAALERRVGAHGRWLQWASRLWVRASRLVAVLIATASGGVTLWWLSLLHPDLPLGARIVASVALTGLGAVTAGWRRVGRLLHQGP